MTVLPALFQQPPLQMKLTAKLCPFKMPFCGLSPCLTPENRISTEPFFKVSVLQFRKTLVPQVISAAGSPVSIRVSEVQFFPLVLVKNKLPAPPLGTAKLKFVPTSVHWCCCFPQGPVPLTPRTMIFGSLIPSAKASADPTASSTATAKT